MEEVNRQILSERNRKIAERVKRERRREYHRRILNVALPLEVLSETDEEMVRPPTTPSDRSASVTSHRGTLARTASNKSVLSLPRIPNSLNPEKLRAAQPMEVHTSFTLYHPIGLVLNFIFLSLFSQKVYLPVSCHISFREIFKMLKGTSLKILTLWCKPCLISLIIW